MKYGVFTKELSKKILSLLFIICFLILPISQISAASNPGKDTLCYGFIAPMFSHEDEIIENQINNRIRHMVNDLLREQIPVYWTSTNITTTVGELVCDVVYDNGMFFGKGSYVIPFTGDDTQDKKLIAIVYDYTQSSEIEENNVIIPVYELMESLVTKVYTLSDVKIAQIWNSFFSSGLKDYVVKAGKCGFLNFEFIEQKDVRKKLDDADYNVLIWGGSGQGTLFSKFIKTFIWDLRYKISSTIRDFVANGGGYVGSCYGASMASAGILPFPLVLIRRAYNPNLSSFVLFAISDTLHFNMFKILGVVEVNLTGIDHPITYGLDPVILNLHIGGPRFVYIGRNTEVIGRFQNCTTFIDGTRCFFLEGKPIWVSSNFGKGKIILFSSHPEMMDADDHTDYLDMDEGVSSGKTTISNSLFYTTSKGLSDAEISSSRNISFISEVFDKTSNLTKDLQETNSFFEDVKSEINQTLSTILDLTNKTNHMLDLIYQIAEKFNVNLSREYFYLNIHIASYTQYDLGLYNGYFNDAKETLSVLEYLYPLLKNDTGFMYEMENLKADLSCKINETKLILEKSQKLSDECNNAFTSYKEKDRRSKHYEKKLEQFVRDFYHQTEQGCIYVPQSFFNSLKFLRHYWYNYEASIVI